MKTYPCHRCGEKRKPSSWIWNNGIEEMIICTECALFMPGDRSKEWFIIYYRETGIERYFREKRESCT